MLQHCLHIIGKCWVIVIHCLLHHCKPFFYYFWVFYFAWVSSYVITLWMCLCTSLEQTWELSTKTQISTDNFFCLHGKEIGGYKTTTHTHQKKNHRFYFRTKYPRNNWRLFSHGCGLFKSLNCEHGRCCYSCRQALGLNTVIPVCFCTMLWLRKTFSESETFTKTAARVINCGEMFNYCGCANKRGGHW